MTTLSSEVFEKSLSKTQVLKFGVFSNNSLKKYLNKPYIDRFSFSNIIFC